MNEDFIADMRNSIYVVTFTKANGEERRMRCTLKSNMIQETTKATTRTKTANPNVVAVWDLEKQAWRSFTKDSVISAVKEA
jgi:hypothetical protein